MYKMNINKRLLDRWVRHYLESEVIVFMLIVQLHYSKKISDEKLKGMLKALRNGTMRYKNTYHCTINDKWYSEETMVDILFDVIEEQIIDIPIETFLVYLNKYLNKNKNFCIDWVYFGVFKPLINIWTNDVIDAIIKSISNVVDVENYKSYEDALESGELSYGYCCSDCDGNFNSYTWSNYNNQYRDFQEKAIKKSMLTYLLSIKTHYRNPNDMLSSELRYI